jgi:glycosyltransferase involved in cell wall biosynthesis
MRNEPQVSIIVPVYNSGKTLNDSLESLFLQTLPSIEIIAVNDASTDESGKILEQISTGESRLRVIHLNTNVGVHEARAVGIKESNAPHIGFLDADDFVKPDMFRKMLECSLRNDADITICGINLCTQDKKRVGIKLSFEKDFTECNDIFPKFCRLEFGTGTLWNKLYRRELLLKHAISSFRWRQDASEDTLVNIGCFLDAKKVHMINDKFYEYTVNPFSTTRTIDSALAFTRLFRAYAIAVDIYRAYGPEVLGQITELYARQLSFSTYHIKKQSELVMHEQSLKEAVSLLSEQYPIGLALMSNNGWYKKYETGSLGECIKLIAQNLKIAPRLFTKAMTQRFQ